jgi:hypothetical protein
MFSHACGSVGRKSTDFIQVAVRVLEPDANPRCFAWSAHRQAERINELWRMQRCASRERTFQLAAKTGIGG